jgi:predicted HicB family RNase H-like nuclease
MRSSRNVARAPVVSATRLLQEAIEAQDNHVPAERPPSRVGKKAVQIFVEPEEHMSLRILAIRQGVSLEYFVKSAINGHLRRIGQPEIALDD